MSNRIYHNKELLKQAGAGYRSYSSLSNAEFEALTEGVWYDGNAWPVYHWFGDRYNEVLKLLRHNKKAQELFIEQDPPCGDFMINSPANIAGHYVLLAEQQ